MKLVKHISSLMNPTHHDHVSAAVNKYVKSKGAAQLTPDELTNLYSKWNTYLSYDIKVLVGNDSVFIEVELSDAKFTIVGNSTGIKTDQGVVVRSIYSMSTPIISNLGYSYKYNNYWLSAREKAFTSFINGVLRASIKEYYFPMVNPDLIHLMYSTNNWSTKYFNQLVGKDSAIRFFSRYKVFYSLQYINSRTDYLDLFKKVVSESDKSSERDLCSIMIHGAVSYIKSSLCFLSDSDELGVNEVTITDKVSKSHCKYLSSLGPRVGFCHNAVSSALIDPPEMRPSTKYELSLANVVNSTIVSRFNYTSKVSSTRVIPGPYDLPVTSITKLAKLIKSTYPDWDNKELVKKLSFIDDYIRFIKNAGRTPTKGLMKLLRCSEVYHDELVRIEGIISRVKLEKSGITDVVVVDASWSPVVDKVYSNSKYSAKFITTESDLKDEGTTMNHCVFHSFSQCMKGDLAVLSIRSLSDERVSTLGIRFSGDKWSLYQNYGKNNDEVSPEVEKFSIGIIESINKEYEFSLHHKKYEHSTRVVNSRSNTLSPSDYDVVFTEVSRLI